MGTAAASAGAAGPSEGLRAGRRISPTTGTLSQNTCYVRQGTGLVVHCLIIAHSFLAHMSPLSCWDLKLYRKELNVIFSAKRRYI